MTFARSKGLRVPAHFRKLHICKLLNGVSLSQSELLRRVPKPRVRPSSSSTLVPM